MREGQPAYCIVPPVSMHERSCCSLQRSKKFASAVEQRTDPQDEREVVERPAFRCRKPAGECTEVPYVPLAPESHHKIGADRIDEKNIEDDRFHPRHHARRMVRNGNVGLAHKIPDSRARCCHIILELRSDPCELWMQSR